MKVLFTSIFALFLATSAWATGELTAPAVCNITDLGASEGPLNIDLVWEPNTINTTWYSEGVQIQDAPQSCSYSNTMILPTAPSRPGYAFAGWTLRCNIPSGLGSFPSSYGYMGANNQAYNNVYGLTEPGTWASTWPNGDVLYGVSVWADNFTGTAPSGSTEPIYCWCGITGYRPSGGTRCDLASTSWFSARSDVIATVSTDLDSEDLMYDVGACAQACVTKYYTYYNGWQETLVPRVQQCPIPSSLAMTSASSYGYINPNGQAYNNTYGLTENGTWAATWPNGDVVYGVAECADNYSGTAPSGHTNNWACWCGVTGYQPSGGSRCNLSNTSWVDWRITNNISTEIDEEGHLCSDVCAQACLTKAVGYGAWRDLFGMPTCNVPSSLFATNPSETAYYDNEGQGYNPNGLSFLGVNASNNFGIWGARWSNGDMVAGVAQCVEDSVAESMINVPSGTFLGAGAGCENGVGTCFCMCGLLAYKPYSGDACIINNDSSNIIWMNDIPAINTIIVDIDSVNGLCEIDLCAQACANDAFLYGGWRTTYGLQ